LYDVNCRMGADLFQQFGLLGLKRHQPTQDMQ
jgi:hypothetical protein